MGYQTTKPYPDAKIVLCHRHAQYMTLWPIKLQALKSTKRYHIRLDSKPRTKKQSKRLSWGRKNEERRKLHRERIGRPRRAGGSRRGRIPPMLVAGKERPCSPESTSGGDEAVPPPQVTRQPTHVDRDDLQEEGKKQIQGELQSIAGV